MENILRPHKKLFIKQWMILLTISVLLAVIALLLQLLIPLDKNVDSRELAAVLWPITAGVILLKWLLFVPILTLWVKNLRYIIEDDRVIIHQGILTKVQKNIPYRAVTDFILHRSLYDRFLGIASIRIQTAGQTQTPTGYEGNIAGLIEWEDLHKDLRNRIKALHPYSAALGMTEKAPAATSESDLLRLVLDELRAIRKAIEGQRQG
jgi:uncharacterized membrane protein YdbT with pleckstrin-like domain